MSEQPIPDLAAQYHGFMALVYDLCREYEQEFEHYKIGPPIIERFRGPARYGVMYGRESTDVPVRVPYTNYRGDVNVNSGRCPWCNCLHFKNATLGDIMTCNNCQKDFQW